MKISRSSIKFFVCSLFLFCSMAFGSVNEKIEWHLIENARKDFTVQMPAKYLVDNSDKEKVYRLIVSEKNFSASVTADMTRPKGNVGQTMRMLARNKDMKFLKAKGVNVAYYLVNSLDNKSKRFWCIVYTNRSVLSFSMSADFENNYHQTFLNRFISSLTLNGEKVFNNFTDSSVADKAVDIQSLRSDQIILDALAVEDSKQSSLLPASAERIDRYRSLNEKKVVDTEKEGIGASEDEDIRSLLILRRPRADYTERARERGIQGSVVLSVEFLATGRIGEISLVSSLEPGMDSQALKAARKIKFIPRKKDGEPVDSQSFVEYNFNLY